MIQCLPMPGSGATAGEISSVYATHAGTITLTWSRASLGLFLLADLSLTPSPSTSPAPDNDNSIADHLRLRIRPYLTWNRKGSKHHHFTSPTDHRRIVSLSWDLSLATFSTERGPEPISGFFLSITVDGEIALVVGEEAIGSKGWELISRRERVRFGGFGGEMSYATKGRIGGKEMGVTIWIDVEVGEMRVGIGGEMVLEVRKLWWKFRGVDGAGLGSGGRILVAWDLHDWFFRREGEAVFVLRFQSEEGGKRGRRDGGGGWWSGSGAVEEMEGWEEGELWSEGEGGGFTLIVYGKTDYDWAFSESNECCQEFIAMHSCFKLDIALLFKISACCIFKNFQ